MEIKPELKKSLTRYAFVSFIFVIAFTILVAKEGGAGIGKTILFFFVMALFGTPCGAVGGAIGNAHSPLGPSRCHYHNGWIVADSDAEDLLVCRASICWNIRRNIYSFFHTYAFVWNRLKIKYMKSILRLAGSFTEPAKRRFSSLLIKAS